MSITCTAEELSLAKRLRRQCNAKGKELRPEETAKLLHKLGRIYHKKKDKFSLIHCVALMTSAILRRPDNAVEIQNDLEETCDSILKLTGSHKRGEFLTECVADVKEKIRRFRNNTSVALKSLEKIPDDIWGDRLDELRRKKVDDMRRIQNQVTETYTAIMKQIADYCVQAMGDPPCKYSLVGLGSLARRDITPFSDFEHVIVLENEVKNKENYADVLEYFRWFATIFQIILVRLGETLLTFLAIPSLNNPLDPSQRWFYDDFTPCGISPDGMAPNASKTPLGCPPMYNDGISCELIKPCDEMVKFFCDNDDPQMQLTTFCNVSGDCLLFEKFNQCLALNRQPMTKNLFTGMIEKCFDKFDFAKMFKELGSSERFDVKRLLYRSATLYVAALGRYFNIDDASCLEIVNHLYAHSKIDMKCRDSLCFCVAVSCEVRLQFYTKKQGQDDILMQAQFYQNRRHLQDIVDAVGAKTLVEAVVFTHNFQQTVLLLVKHHVQERSFIYPWINPTVLDYLYVCNRLKLYSLCNMIVNAYPERSMLTSAEDRLILVYFEVDSLKGMQKYATAVQVAKRYLKHDFDSALCESPFGFALLFLYGVSLHYSGKYKAAIRIFQKVNFSFYKNERKNEIKIKISLQGQMSVCYSRLGRFAKSLKYAQRELAEVQENCPNPKFVFEYYDALFNMGVCYRCFRRYDECKAVLQRVIDEKQTFLPSEHNDTRVNQCLLELGACYYEQDQFDEALKLFEQVDQSYEQQNTGYKLDLHAYLILMGDCLVVSKRYEEAMCVFYRAIDEFKKVKPYKSRKIYQKLSLCWLHLSVCASDMGEDQFATECFQKSEAKRKAAGKSAPQFQSPGHLRYSRGLQLYNAEKYSEALLCFCHKDCRRFALSTNSDTEVSLSYHAYLSECYRQLNQLEKAEEERRLAFNLSSNIDWSRKYGSYSQDPHFRLHLDYLDVTTLYQQASYAQVVPKVKKILTDASCQKDTRRVLIVRINVVVHMAASLTQLLKYEESMEASESALRIALQVSSPQEQTNFESVIQLLDNIRRCKICLGKIFDHPGKEFSPSVYWHAFNVARAREPFEDVMLLMRENALGATGKNPEDAIEEMLKLM